MPRISRKLTFSLTLIIMAMSALPLLPVRAVAYTETGVEAPSTVKAEDVPETTDNHNPSKNNSQDDVTKRTPKDIKDKSDIKANKLGKEQRKQLSDQERQERCEKRKNGLQTKFANLVANGQRHHERLSEIHAKVLAFKEEKNLSPAGVDELVVSADEAKTNSATSLINLKTIQPALDCTSKQVVADIAVFKTAAEQVRSDLKDYKSAIKALLKSLKAAASDRTTGDRPVTPSGGSQ